MAETLENLEEEVCSVHTGRPAVARCASCGRNVCLACAVPIRGEVMCAQCAARTLGEPAPVPAVRPPKARARMDFVVGALLVVGLLATIPPWDAFGALTGFFSAWRPNPDAWPLLAGLSLLIASATVLIPVAGRRSPGMTATLAYTFLSALAAVAVLVTLLRTPDYVSHTAAPYLALGCAAAATALGLLRLRGRARAG